MDDNEIKTMITERLQDYDEEHDTDDYDGHDDYHIIKNIT